MLRIAPSSVPDFHIQNRQVLRRSAGQNRGSRNAARADWVVPSARATRAI